jgi:hypothetical protein
VFFKHHHPQVFLAGSNAHRRKASQHSDDAFSIFSLQISEPFAAFYVISDIGIILVSNETGSVRPKQISLVRSLGWPLARWVSSAAAWRTRRPFIYAYIAEHSSRRVRLTFPHIQRQEECSFKKEHVHYNAAPRHRVSGSRAPQPNSSRILRTQQREKNFERQQFCPLLQSSKVW